MSAPLSGKSGSTPQVRELDEGILNRLISRILVGEMKKVGGEKFQEIKIIYNFVSEIPAVTE